MLVQVYNNHNNNKNKSNNNNKANLLYLDHSGFIKKDHDWIRCVVSVISKPRVCSYGSESDRLMLAVHSKNLSKVNLIDLTDNSLIRD